MSAIDLTLVIAGSIFIPAALAALVWGGWRLYTSTASEIDWIAVASVLAGGAILSTALVVAMPIMLFPGAVSQLYHSY